jgi:hypothetical protein
VISDNPTRRGDVEENTRIGIGDHLFGVSIVIRIFVGGTAKLRIATVPTVIAFGVDRCHPYRSSGIKISR